MARQFYLVVAGFDDRLIWGLHDGAGTQTGLLPADASKLQAAAAALEVATNRWGAGTVLVISTDDPLIARAPELRDAFPTVALRLVSSSEEPIETTKVGAREAGRVPSDVSNVTVGVSVARTVARPYLPGAGWSWLSTDGSFGYGFCPEHEIGFLAASAIAACHAIAAAPAGKPLVLRTAVLSMLVLDHRAHRQPGGGDALQLNLSTRALVRLLQDRPEVRIRRIVNTWQRKMQAGATKLADNNSRGSRERRSEAEIEHEAARLAARYSAPPVTAGTRHLRPARRSSGSAVS